MPKDCKFVMIWEKIMELARKLRGMGYYVEVARSDDEIFERYTIIIERDKLKKSEYFG